jgi:hypothetical protein
MSRSLTAVVSFATVAAATSFASATLTTSAAIYEVLGSVSVAPTSTATFNIGGRNSGLIGPSVPPEFDQFVVTGDFSLAGTLRIALFNDFVPVLGDSFTLVHALGDVTFSGNFTAPALADGMSWQVTVGTGGMFGTEGSTLVASVVPAPGAIALLAVGGIVSGSRRRR